MHNHNIKVYTLSGYTSSSFLNSLSSEKKQTNKQKTIFYLLVREYRNVTYTLEASATPVFH